jgi:hypothetical protein
MGAAAHYPRAIKAEQFLFRPHRRYLCALLSLLAVLGALAFVFSAISPIDDETQQEFFQSSKSKQFVLVEYKAVSNLRTFPAHTVHGGLASSKPQFPAHKSAVCVLVPGDEINTGVCSSRSRDRSPPAKAT